MAATPVDNAFFNRFGPVAPNTLALRRTTFLDLVSLFDSLHDFGRYGTVYDYVTGPEGAYITHRRTVFNHLRNSYATLVGVPNVSLLNSQLRWAEGGFYLRASIGKSDLEPTFYNYAQTRLRIRAPLQTTHANLTIANLRTEFNLPNTSNFVFSIDTQKKFHDFTNRVGPLNPAISFLQVVDSEKVCDPAGHATGDQHHIKLLRELEGQNRIYNNVNGNNVNGVEQVTLQNFNQANFSCNIRIDLSGSNGVLTPVTMNAGDRHINAKTTVNRQLHNYIANFDNGEGGNQNVRPSLGFYNNINYINPQVDNLLNHIRNIRRNLAQKRLGDQLQVLACRKVIQYTRDGVTYRVQHPIFVSIDQMAIAYAIALGVNCIYSHGNDLTLFRGTNPTTIQRVNGAQLAAVQQAIPRSLQSEMRKENTLKTRKQRGGDREDWEQVEADLRSTPYHIVNLFLYTGIIVADILGGFLSRYALSQFVMNVPFVSTKINQSDNTIGGVDRVEYCIRSFQNGLNRRITIHNPENAGHQPNNMDTIFFARQGANNYRITYQRGYMHYYTLYKNNIQQTWYSLYTLRGIYAAVRDNEVRQNIHLRSERIDSQIGGDSTQNRNFVHMLAKYDIHCLVDDEQMNIWYDEFYVVTDGIPFYSPTFYELNALFQELFQKKYSNINYESLLPYLKQQSATNLYANSCYVALSQIYEYMNKEEEHSEEINEITAQTFNSILQISANVSAEYEANLTKLKGSDLLQYIYDKDITPLYFLNTYVKLYDIKLPPPPPKITEEIPTTISQNKAALLPLTVNPSNQIIASTNETPSNYVIQPSAETAIANPAAFQGVESFRKARRTKRRAQRNNKRTTRKNNRRRN